MKRLDRKYFIEDDTVKRFGTNEPIPSDEPVILFRAKDRLAIPLLIEYRTLCAESGCGANHMSLVVETLSDFLTFAQKHPERMKRPD